MYRRRRSLNRFIPLFILGIILLIIALNFGKIKFLLGMIDSYMSVDYEDADDEYHQLAAEENPLLSIMEGDAENAEVVREYNDEFELMRDDYQAKLDSLIRVRYQEYRSGEESIPKLANQLLKEGSRLEKECDDDFNAMVKEMEKELEANDHDTQVIEDLREYYNSYKKTEKGRLIQKARRHMN